MLQQELSFYSMLNDFIQWQINFNDVHQSFSLQKNMIQ